MSDTDTLLNQLDALDADIEATLAVIDIRIAYLQIEENNAINQICS
jgi:hypothetical protein